MTEYDRDRNRRRDVGDEVREGIRAGLGILGALKDAIEETVDDMLDRGELSQDRAREAVRTTMDRAQEAFDDARTRFEPVPRREFEELMEDVKELRRRVVRLESEANVHEEGPGGRSDRSGGAPDSGPDAGGYGGTDRPDIPVSED